ncbi:MAG: hypothetical protein ACLGHY_10130, partial [Gammaproteobacteria bacterium]
MIRSLRLRQIPGNRCAARRAGICRRLAVLVAPALLVFAKIAAPFVYVIERTASVISRALGVR